VSVLQGLSYCAVSDVTESQERKGLQNGQKRDTGVFKIDPPTVSEGLERTEEAILNRTKSV
jgi:hypothetical protein